MWTAWIGALIGIVTLTPLVPAPAQVPPPLADVAQAAEFRERRDAILARERAQLATLPAALQPAPDPAPAADGSTRFVPLPPVVPGLAAAKPDEARRDAIRDEAASALVALASDVAKAKPAAYAMADACLRLALERRPDHPEARRLLGFIPHEGGWATPFAVANLKQGMVDDPTFGWVQGNWIAHLRRGELPAPGGNGRWLPAAQADALRRDWSKRWQIETEHFVIGTNVPLADAISFGRKLELLHELFFSLAADVVDPKRLPLAQRYEGREVKPTPPDRRHRVSYFATRDEYAQHVSPMLGESAWQSLGYYVPKRESRTLGAISYFFNDPGGQLPIEATLFHEGSHQLLFENGGPDAYDRNAGNYWVFEGLGTFFETLTIEPDGSLRIGGLVGPRIENARLRLLDRGEFVPTRELVAMSKGQFNEERTIRLHYAESMALVVFLMQADGGLHREPFLDYVEDAYKGRLRNGSGRSLEARLGLRYPELDRKLLDYLRPR